MFSAKDVKKSENKNKNEKNIEQTIVWQTTH